MVLIDHLTFGFGVTVLGSWWSLGVLKRYLDCQSTNTCFTSSAFYPDERWTRLPTEPVLKGVFLFLQFTLELALYLAYESLTNCGSDASSDFNVLAVLWRCWLILHVCLEVAQFYHPEMISREILYICLIVSASVIGTFLPILPSGHVSHSSSLTLMVQQLFVAAIFFFSIATIFEMVLIHSLAMPLIRATSTVLIGLWLMTMAFLFEPPTDYFTAWGENQRSVKDAALLFGCYIFMSGMYVAWISAQLMAAFLEKRSSLCNVVLRTGSLPNKADLTSVEVYLAPLHLKNKAQTFV